MTQYVLNMYSMIVPPEYTVFFGFQFNRLLDTLIVRKSTLHIVFSHVNLSQNCRLFWWKILTGPQKLQLNHPSKICPKIQVIKIYIRHDDATHKMKPQKAILKSVNEYITCLTAPAKYTILRQIHYLVLILCKNKPF